MKTDIILAGVGGQGILSIATVIGLAAMKKGLNIKQAEVHGMSQRGGAVQSNLRISSKPISSDLIPEGQADVILSVEPMEALRYLPFLRPEGWVVTNIRPFRNIPDYPDMEALIPQVEALPRVVTLDADQLASDSGNARSSNMVMLGAATPFLNLSPQEMEEAITEIFQRKGPGVVQTNLCAYRSGLEIARKRQEASR